MTKKRYLATISFDCNDADYVYGTQVLTEEEAKIVEENGDKLIMCGSYDFGGGAERTVDESVSVQEITEEEYNVLQKLGLDHFGESIDIDDLPNAPVGEEEEEEEEDF